MPEFLLPDIGEGVAEGEIVQWHVKPGDRVNEEQDFVEVMTDKATVMIPCPVDGVVGELLASEGDIVPVHTAIATFSEVTGGKLAGAHGHAPAAAETRQAAAGGGGTAVAAPPAAMSGLLLAEPQKRVLATPATRRLARALEVDIRRVRGTGPKGRVTREDVERALNGAASAPAPVSDDASATQTAKRPRPAAAAAPVTPAPLPPVAIGPPPAGEVEERVPLRGVRRKISEQMARSKRTAAHYTYVEEVDVTNLVALREGLKPLATARGTRITYLAFIVKAVCNALRQHPGLNCALDEATQEIVYKRYFNLGIAADTERGLVVPVLKHADRRSLLDISREITRLAEGARGGSLSPDDLTGSTFTITSAGHLGGLLATPILNYPEVAILGVHKIKKRPVVKDDQIVIADILYLSLSLDHRVVDGADAARFMNDVVQYLEDPELFILEGCEVSAEVEAEAATAPDLGLAQVLDADGNLLEGAERPDLPGERLVELYQTMVLMRAIDLRLEGLQRMGRIGFFGSARGQEASVVGSGAALQPQDWVFPALRENAIMLLRGYPLSKRFAHMFGNQHDPLRGRMQPMHFAAREVNQVSWSSTIATQMLHATGAAYAMKQKGDGAIAMTFIGDGGTSEPDFANALNFGAVWNVPAVFICQNNQWAISVPCSAQSASQTFAVKARAYGIPGVRVDGNDLLAVVREVQRAAERARSGGGPTFLELVTFRMGGHSSADDPTRYRDDAQVQYWLERDPLSRARTYLEGEGLWDEAQEEALEARWKEQINAAVREAEQAALPPPLDIVEDVYAAPPPALLEQKQRLADELAQG